MKLKFRMVLLLYSFGEQSPPPVNCSHTFPEQFQQFMPAQKKPERPHWLSHLSRLTLHHTRAVLLWILQPLCIRQNDQKKLLWYAPTKETMVNPIWTINNYQSAANYYLCKANYWWGAGAYTIFVKYFWNIYEFLQDVIFMKLCKAPIWPNTGEVREHVQYCLFPTKCGDINNTLDRDENEDDGCMLFFNKKRRRNKSRNISKNIINIWNKIWKVYLESLETFWNIWEAWFQKKKKNLNISWQIIVEAKKLWEISRQSRLFSATEFLNRKRGKFIRDLENALEKQKEIIKENGSRHKSKLKVWRWNLQLGQRGFHLAVSLGIWLHLIAHILCSSCMLGVNMGYSWADICVHVFLYSCVFWCVLQ